MEILKTLRKEKKKTQQQMATYLGLSQQAYATYELDTRTPPIDILQKIADYFNVSVDYLLGRSENILPSNGFEIGNMLKMQVIGSISAGYDGIAQEEVLDEIGILEISLKGYSKNECFLLKVKGNSMYPDLLNGDIVAVHRQSSVDSGDIAIILYNGDEATVKKVEYKKGEDWMKLIPRNPEYETKTINGSDLELCHVLGKVISLVHRVIK